MCEWKSFGARSDLLLEFAFEGFDFVERARKRQIISLWSLINIIFFMIVWRPGATKCITCRLWIPSLIRHMWRQKVTDDHRTCHTLMFSGEGWNDCWGNRIQTYMVFLRFKTNATNWTQLKLHWRNWKNNLHFCLSVINRSKWKLSLSSLNPFFSIQVIPLQLLSLNSSFYILSKLQKRSCRKTWSTSWWKRMKAETTQPLECWVLSFHDGIFMR